MKTWKIALFLVGTASFGFGAFASTPSASPVSASFPSAALVQAGIAPVPRQASACLKRRRRYSLRVRGGRRVRALRRLAHRALSRASLPRALNLLTLGGHKTQNRASEKLARFCAAFFASLQAPVVGTQPLMLFRGKTIAVCAQHGSLLAADLETKNRASFSVHMFLKP